MATLIAANGDLNIQISLKRVLLECSMNRQCVVCAALPSPWGMNWEGKESPFSLLTGVLSVAIRICGVVLFFVLHSFMLG